MKRCFCYLAFFWAWAAMAALAQSAAEPKNPLGHSPQIAAEGHTLYNQTCTGCHGMDGREGERAPALIGERRFFRVSEGAIYETIKQGIPGTAMAAINLPDQDIWKIVVFIRAMRSSASEADVPGNVEHGKEIFSGKGGCTKCHAINGKGGTIGPDLSSIGSQTTLPRLKESLTAEGPIPAGYQPIKVTTRTGAQIEGLAKNQDDFSIQLLDYQNHLHLLDRSELKSVEVSNSSLMPHNYDKVLSPEEFNDLVAMLARQSGARGGRRRNDGEGEAGR